MKVSYTYIGDNLVTSRELKKHSEKHKQKGLSINRSAFFKYKFIKNMSISQPKSHIKVISELLVLFY